MNFTHHFNLTTTQPMKHVPKLRRRVMRYKIIEINNPIAVHALCDTLEGANRWININAVEYCSRGYFIDKTLTPESFKVEAVKHVPAKQKVQKVKTVLGYTPNPLLHKALAKQ